MTASALGLISLATANGSPAGILRQEQFDRERRRRSPCRTASEDRTSGVTPSPGWHARRRVQQFARHVGHVLEVHVLHLARLQHVEILHLVEPGPEVIAVEQRADVGVCRRACDRQQRRERRDERGRAHELEAAFNWNCCAISPNFPHVVGGRLVVVRRRLDARLRRRVDDRDPELGPLLAALLETVHGCRAFRVRLESPATPHAPDTGVRFEIGEHALCGRNASRS